MATNILLSSGATKEGENNREQIEHVRRMQDHVQGMTNSSFVLFVAKVLDTNQVVLVTRSKSPCGYCYSIQNVAAAQGSDTTSKLTPSTPPDI